MLERFRHLFSEDVRKEAEVRFGLMGVPWTVLDGSHSYVYDYDLGDRNVVLKITHTLHRTADQINGEQDFLHHLAVNGVTVSRSVASTHGKIVEMIPAQEGEFLAWAFEKAPGALVEWATWTPSKYSKWGAVLGRMHRLTKTYHPPDPA